MAKSKQLSGLIQEVLQDMNITEFRNPTDSHLKIAHAAAMKALGGDISPFNAHPRGPVDVSIKNFVFDPYGTRCTWVQSYEDKECSVELFSMEYQAANAVQDSIRNYHPGQGIHLILTFGRSSIGVPGSFKQQGGSKILSVSSKKYVHRETYRGLDTMFYKVLSDLVSAARVKGLEGIKFPEDWDEVPYD
jgi:hypothetical protein